MVMAMEMEMAIVGDGDGDGDGVDTTHYNSSYLFIINLKIRHGQIKRFQEIFHEIFSSKYFLDAQEVHSSRSLGATHRVRLTA